MSVCPCGCHGAHKTEAKAKTYDHVLGNVLPLTPPWLTRPATRPQPRTAPSPTGMVAAAAVAAAGRAPGFCRSPACGARQWNDQRRGVAVGGGSTGAMCCGLRHGGGCRIANQHAGPWCARPSSTTPWPHRRRGSVGGAPFAFTRGGVSLVHSRAAEAGAAAVACHPRVGLHVALAPRLLLRARVGPGGGHVGARAGGSGTGEAEAEEAEAEAEAEAGGHVGVCRRRACGARAHHCRHGAGPQVGEDWVGTELKPRSKSFPLSHIYVVKGPCGTPHKSAKGAPTRLALLAI